MASDLRISGVEPESIVDGPGFRYVIFTQGCPHHCPGCHNPQTHDFAGGKVADIPAILAEIQSDPLLQGVTFSGGEPFCQPAPLCAIARAVKGGMEETVGAIAGESPEILMETASMGEIEQDISWTPELRAPVRKGDVIGRITYSAKGETVAQVDITAAGDVEKISFSSAFTYLLHSFLGL